MEDIKLKLRSGRGPAIDAAASKLAERLLSLADRMTLQAPEVSLLWEEVKSDEPLRSRTCAGVLADLACRRGSGLDPAATLAGLLSIAPQVRRPEGLVAAVGRILRDHCAPRGVRFGLSSNPHPFVTLLRSFPSCWPHIHAQTLELCASGVSLQFMKPLLLYAFCDPNPHAHLSALRSALLDLIGINRDLRMIRSLVEWISYMDKAAFYENATIVLKLIDMMKCDEPSQELPLILSLCVRGAKLGFNNRALFNAVDERLARIKTDALSIPSYLTDICVLLLVNIYKQSPSRSHHEILIKALAFNGLSSTHPIVFGLLFSAVLETLPYQKKISAEFHRDISSIFQILVTIKKQPGNERREIPQLPWIVSHDFHVQRAMSELQLMYTVGENEKYLQLWIDSVANLCLSDTHPILSVLLSVACAVHHEDIAIKAFELLFEAAASSPQLAHSVLSLVLYVLSNEEVENLVKLFVLEQLPKLGSDKTSVAFILQLIKSFDNALQFMRMRLLYDLWLVEDRVYPYLKSALEEPTKDGPKCETTFVKAKITRDVCLAKPEDKGADLLPILSAILNDQIEERDSAACLLALEGITCLCKSGVIDIQTTISVMKPKLEDDMRSSIAAAYLTEVVALVPSFEINSSVYEEFRKATLSELWKKLMREETTQIKSALFQTISKFPQDDYTLECLPNFATDQLNKTVQGSGEDQTEMDYVPGNCFVQALINCDENDTLSYGMIVRELLKKEVQSFPRGLYHLDPAKKERNEEPNNYKHLPEKSILRAIVSCLSANTVDLIIPRARLEELIGCLVLDQSLPPFNWSLLAQLPCQEKLFEIVCRQCIISISALQMVKHFIEKQSISVHCFDIIFKHLGHLSNSDLDQDTLTSFVEATVRHEIEKSPPGMHDRTLRLLHHMKDVLTRNDGECPALVEAFEHLFQSTDLLSTVEDPVHQAFLDIVPFLPVRSLEKLSRFSASVEDSEFVRVLSVRAQLAGSSVSDMPLSWLNAAVDYVSQCPHLLPDLLRAMLTTCTNLRRIKFPVNNHQWLQELMGQIRSISRSETSPDRLTHRKRLAVLFDIFSFAVIMFSESDAFICPREQLCTSETLRRSLLPVALGRLVRMWPQLGPPMVEWLTKLTVEKRMHEEFFSCEVKNAMLALKDIDKYNEAWVWNKLVIMELNLEQI